MVDAITAPGSEAFITKNVVAANKATETIIENVATMTKIPVTMIKIAVTTTRLILGLARGIALPGSCMGWH